jgi:hypothetical protein
MERAQVRHVLRLEPKAEEPLRPFLAIAQVVEHVLQLVHVAHLPPEPFVPLDAPACLGAPV